MLLCKLYTDLLGTSAYAKIAPLLKELNVSFDCEHNYSALATGLLPFSTFSTVERIGACLFLCHSVQDDGQNPLRLGQGASRQKSLVVMTAKLH